MTAPNTPDTTTVVLDHLRDVARNDPAAFVSPRSIADAVGKGYSTVTAALRDLAAAGHVLSEKRGAATVWAAKDYAPAMTPPAADDAAETGHAVVGDIDTTETAPAVDLSGDALDLAGAGIDVTAPADPAWHDMRTPAETAAPVAPAIPDDRTAAVDVVAPATVTLTPATAAFTPPAAPAGDDVDAVLSFMTAVRPVSAPPADTDTETTPRRVRRSTAPTDRRNDWGNGGLQPAILAWFAQQPDGHVAGPSEIANALTAHTSSVAYSLKQLTKKGRTVRMEGSTPRFRVATGDGAVGPADAGTVAETA